MMGRLHSALSGLTFLVMILSVGCATTPSTTTPGPASSGPSQGGRGSGSPSISERATGPSSLEAQRKGRTAETPATSPLHEIFFDFDRYDLRPEARETLKVNADWLKSNPSARVEIEGHCDERGTSEYNLALGAKRAQAAKDYLITLGIAAGRLSTISYGEELPVCTEKNEQCWQRNRRARFVIVGGRPAS